MSKAPRRTEAGARAGRARRITTLLEVVNVVAEVAATDEEVVAVICDLLASRRLRLLGQFTESDFQLA